MRPASGHRAAVGVARRHTPPARRAPSSATTTVASMVASRRRRLSLGGSGAPDVRTNQSCKACKHETRNAICNLVVRIPNRYRFGSCLIVVHLLYLRRGWLYLDLAAWRPWLPPSHARTCTSHHLAPSRMHLSLVTCRMFSSASPTSTRLSPPPSSPQPHPTCSSNPSLPRASLDSACIAQLSAPHASP